MSRIEDEVCKKIAQRAEVGKNKYGVTMETAPLSRLEWLIHAQEEAMDLAVYLQKLIEMEQKTIHEKMQERADRINDMRRAHSINKWNDEAKE
jgi:hypothetical protein